MSWQICSHPFSFVSVHFSVELFACVSRVTQPADVQTTQQSTATEDACRLSDAIP